MNTTMRMKAIPYEPATAKAEGVHFEQIITIKRILATSAVLLVFALTALGYSTAEARGTSSWETNFDSAKHTASRLNKPMFVMIARTGCHACASMEQNLANPATRRALGTAVKVRLETSEYPAMTTQYAAGGTPTTLIYAPGNYNLPVYSYTGAMDLNTIIQVGRSIDSMR